jgi:hypothetical protein
MRSLQGRHDAKDAVVARPIMEMVFTLDPRATEHGVPQ